MIDKFDFGDLYKFLVSSGIVLIGISFLLPWIFLKEPFDLMITEQQLSFLTPQAQEIIRSRQNFLHQYSWIIFLVTLISLLLGIFNITYGMIKWFTKQTNLDKKEQLETKKVEKELKQMDETELKERVEKEFKESDISSISQNDFISNYRRIEEFFIGRFARLYSDKYTLKVNRKIGNHPLDLVLSSKNSKSSDYIIEFKFVSRLIHSKLKAIVLDLIEVTKEYISSVNKKAMGILIIIVREEDFNETTIGDVLKQYVNSNLLRIEIVGYDLNKLDDSFFKKIIEN